MPRTKRATLAEVSKLYDDAGGLGPYKFGNGSNGGAAEDPATALLLSLLGNTGALNLPGGQGITADLDTSGGTGSPSTRFLAFYSHLPPTTNYLLAPFGSQVDTASSSVVGSFLIRNSAVPEPASLVLLGTGLVALAAARRRRRAR